MAFNEIRHRARVEKRYAAEIPAIMGSPGKLDGFFSEPPRQRRAVARRAERQAEPHLHHHLPRGLVNAIKHHRHRVGHRARGAAASSIPSSRQSPNRRRHGPRTLNLSRDRQGARRRHPGPERPRPRHHLHCHSPRGHRPRPPALRRRPPFLGRRQIESCSWTTTPLSSTSISVVWVHSTRSRPPSGAGERWKSWRRARSST